jgi:hypothetical protein
MKNLARIVLLVLLCISLAAAQNASDYFPSKIGNAWRYQRFSLDTLQNQIVGSKTIVSDSLAGTKLVKGSLAYVLLSGNKPPFDSTYVRVEGSTISEYLVGYPRITSLLPVDSLGLGFVWGYLNWYSYMNFGATPRTNVIDTLLYLKKTVIFNGANLPLIITVTATKIRDTSITVPAGSYLTTPFQLVLYVNLPKSVPPIGHIEVPLFKLIDTVFVAKNNWVVKEIQPSTFYPLNNDTSYKVATTQLPGFVRLLESATITSVAQHDRVPGEFRLEQNYPNPFNPATVISYQLAVNSFVTMRVFDLIGREVATLVNENLAAGNYDITFNAAGLSSGVYFYRLTADDMVQTRKMILQK